MTSPIGTIEQVAAVGYDNNDIGPTAVQTVTATAPVAATTGENPVISIAAATTAAPGSMSAADKTKLDALLTASYGETYEFNETGSTLTLTTQNTAYRWVTGGAGVVKGTDYVTWNDAAAPTGKRLTVGAGGAGVYLVTATFAGNLAKHADLSMDVYKNASAATNITCDFHVTEDGSYVAGSASGLLTLAADDTVTMWFSASIGTNAFTIKHANVSIVRIDV